MSFIFMEIKNYSKISPSKRAFEKYKPWGLFSEFYTILINTKKKKKIIIDILFKDSDFPMSLES